jgi:peptidoglycan/LPS O-acetylase OafA/YrhL
MKPQLQTKNPILHVPSIDAMRGIAALAVLFYHLLLIPSLDLPDYARAFPMKGGSGVTLFFVISAFTLCLSWDNKKKSERFPTLSFILRRIFRVVPLFYVLLIAYLIKDYLVFNKIHSWHDIALNLSFLYNFVPGKHTSIVWAGWTLGIEIVFYFLFPILIRLNKNVFTAFMFFIFSTIIAYQWKKIVPHITDSSDYLYMSFLTQLPVFTLGFLVYRLFCDIPKIKFLSITGFGLFVLLFWPGMEIQFPDQWGLAPTAIVISFFVVYLLHNNSILNNRIFRAFGKVSYSIYLTHPLIIWSLLKPYERIYSIGLPRSISYLVCATLTISITYAISTILYYLIEAPSQNIGKKLVLILNSTKTPVNRNLLGDQEVI